MVAGTSNRAQNDTGHSSGFTILSALCSMHFRFASLIGILYELQSKLLAGGYIADYIGDYSRGYSGGY